MPKGGSTAGRSASPSEAVRTLQVLVAQELVEGRGVPARRAAELLGLAPSAVSQYLSGKRLRRELAAHGADARSRRVASAVADRLVRRSARPVDRVRAILSGAQAMAGTGKGSWPATPAPADRGGHPPSEQFRTLARWARTRIRTEQDAVAQCMRLAQKARDELTRAVFRQIASDSLRHAEIVASLTTYLDRGTSNVYASGITPREVRDLIDREREAETEVADGTGPPIGGLLALLLESMEADERKHARMLQGLLESGFPRP